MKDFMEEKSFKELIKNILLENGYIKPKYNNNISRESFWENNFQEYKEQFFETYKKWCNEYLGNKQVSFFIKSYFFDENPRKFYLFKKFKDIKDYFLNANHEELCNKYYHKLFKSEFKDIVNFETKNIYEVKYCFENKIKERPKCKECNKDSVFVGQLKNSYYRDFCCLKCQIDYNNKEKEPKLSNLTDDEIREKLKEIAPDRRNLTNPKFAEFYLNIYNYSKELIDLKQTERQFLFLNKLDLNFILCPYCKCNKKIFISSVKGYKETCGRKQCVYLHLFPNANREIDFKENERYCANRNDVLDKSFLYLIYSKKNDFYKIGISTEPTNRISSFLKFFDDFEIKFCVYLENANKIEDQLHKYFSKKQVLFENAFDGHTEYFKLNENDLEHIKKVIYENI